MRMTFNEWVEKYKPVRTKDGEIYAFETYGSHMKFVSQQEAEKVWTLLDGDIIICGKRFINRCNYFVTEIPWEEDWTVIEFGDDDKYEIYYGY
jgi:hypothetical protein